MEKMISIEDVKEVLDILKARKNVSPETSETVKSLIEYANTDNQQENIWTDFSLMIHDMKKHVSEHGGFIVRQDNSVKLCIGYRCTKTNKAWEIKVNDAQKSMNSSKEGQMLVKAFSSPEGKESFLSSINGK